MNTTKRLCLKACLLLCGGWMTALHADEPAYVPKAQQVVANVYAIVGPLVQRSEANAGLNANYGFVVTEDGVILIDSGASAHSAQMLAQAVRAVTPKPIRWVLNTGSQDHRWLGNDYFARQGAEVHALAATAQTQREHAQRQIEGMKRFVGEQMKGTQARPADVLHAGPDASLILGGVSLRWIDTSAHYPGDAMIHLSDASVVFTGDLVYVERLLGVLPFSSVRNGARGFERLKALKPQHIVPGHGRVTDMAQAQRDTGDYYEFLITHVGEAARDMAPMAETLDRFASPQPFVQLQNFDQLHRANMNRVFVDFESNP